MLVAMTNATASPYNYLRHRTFGLRGLIAVSGSTVAYQVCDADRDDVGIAIPLVGSRQLLVVRTDTKHFGFWTLKLLTDSSQLVDRIDRVPESEVLATALEASVTGQMGAF